MSSRRIRPHLRHWLRGLILFPLIGLHLHAAEPIRIGIIGDSTVSTYDESSPRRGWGQMLASHMEDTVMILNEAQPGRSTKTFPKNRWQKLLALHPDFILIQFGHNDSHPAHKPESVALPDYETNLKRYVAEARTAGATLILVTPPRRVIFKQSGNLSAELQPYVDAMKRVAASEHVPLIDLYQSSGERLAAIGPEDSKGITVSEEDRTHFTAQGAALLAALVARDLASCDPRLATAIRPEPAE